MGGFMFRVKCTQKTALFLGLLMLLVSVNIGLSTMQYSNLPIVAQTQSTSFEMGADELERQVPGVES